MVIYSFFRFYANKFVKFLVIFFRFSNKQQGLGLKAFIGLDEVEIPLTDLTMAPPFLHFNEFRLWHSFGSEAIAEKCKSYEACLQMIKPMLNASKETNFECKIDENYPNHFFDHSALLEYLGDRIVPICDPSRHISFSIDLDSDKDSSTNIIASIIKFPQITRCTNVGIKLYTAKAGPLRLPIEIISNWFNRTSNSMEQKQKEQFLEIFCCEYFQNSDEMCQHLKEVFTKI